MLLDFTKALIDFQSLEMVVCKFFFFNLIVAFWRKDWQVLFFMLITFGSFRLVENGYTESFFSLSVNC